MDRQKSNNSDKWIPINRNRPASLNMNPSLPEYSFIWNSSVNSERNLSIWSPTGQEQISQNEFPDFEADHSYIRSPSVFGNSPISPFLQNHNSFVDDIQRTRSFSYENSLIATRTDDRIIGPFNESGGFRPRSKSFVDSGFQLNESVNESSSFSSPNKSSRSSRKASNRNPSHSSEDDECSYCKATGADFHGHNNKNCPELVKLNPCNVCGASGVDNHTKNHCPYSKKELLPMKPEVEARLTDNIRKRTIKRKEEQKRPQNEKLFHQNRRE